MTECDDHNPVGHFNRDDIRRVYASFAAEYKITAEWTGLHAPAFVTRTVEQIIAIAAEQVLQEVHLQLKRSARHDPQCFGLPGIDQCFRLVVGPSGDLYWESYAGDRLQLIVYFTEKWRALTLIREGSVRRVHMPDWGVNDFDGNYGTMTQNQPPPIRESGAYGLERTDYSA